MVKAFIAGATGKQEGAAARALLTDGHQVHALVRDPDSAASQALRSQGAVLFQGDLLDAASIEPAVAGTTPAFWPAILFFRNMSQELRAYENILSAARREVDLFADRITIRETFDVLEEAAGKSLTVRTYEPEEALEKAALNPIVSGQLLRVRLAETVGEWGTAAREDFGLGFTSFRGYIEKNKHLAIETYKHVP